MVFGSLAPSIVNVFAVSTMHDGGPHIPVLGGIARVVGLTPFGWATAAFTELKKDGVFEAKRRSSTPPSPTP